MNVNYQLPANRVSSILWNRVRIGIMRPGRLRRLPTAEPLSRRLETPKNDSVKTNKKSIDSKSQCRCRIET